MRGTAVVAGKAGVPRVTPSRPDLFGTPTAEADELHALATELLAAGVLAPRLDKHGRSAFGEKLKRVVFRGRRRRCPWTCSPSPARRRGACSSRSAR